MTRMETETVSRRKGPTARGRGKRMFLVLWWLDQTPYVAQFDDQFAADAAARVRNATVVEVRGEKVEVPRVLDYYRRDEQGQPMPAKWKVLEDVEGKPRFPGFRLSV